MYRRRITAALLGLLLLSLSANASEPETGEASWYGPGFHGRRTANGEVFDKESLTAAHRTLPFGTVLLVRNLENGREVTVRINDRGPFARGRILDLSEAAARRLGMIEPGTARVSLRIVPPPAGGSPARPAAVPGGGETAKPASVPTVRIQVASYRDPSNAGRTADRLRLSGMKPSLEREGGYTRVVLADVPASEKDTLLRRLADLGYPGVLVREETRL